MSLVIVATVGIYLVLRGRLLVLSDPAFFRTIVAGYAVLGAMLAIAGVMGRF